MKRKTKRGENFLTVGGLFSGVGGIELGFHNAGFDIAWSNEIDPAAMKTLSSNFDHLKIHKDIKKFKSSEVPAVDVLVGGFPCQAFSIAGYRKGFEDDRGNLFFEIERLIREQRKVHGYQPKALFLENVKNFYTHDNRNTFEEVKKRLKRLGYYVFHGVLNTASMTAIPQNRERIFLICFEEGAGDASLIQDAFSFDSDHRPMSRLFASNLPLSPQPQPRHIRDFLERGRVDEKYYYREDRYMYPELVESITSRDTVYQWRRLYVRENKSNMCPTLTANMGTGGHNVPLIKDAYGIRKLTPRECFNFQGFPESFELPQDLPDSQLYKQAGNSVTVPLIERLAKLMKKSMEKSLG
jgi:DNA (cytosine-5)-methyltransferase 1